MMTELLYMHTALAENFKEWLLQAQNITGPVISLSMLVEGEIFIAQQNKYRGSGGFMPTSYCILHFSLTNGQS